MARRAQNVVKVAQLGGTRRQLARSSKTRWGYIGANTGRNLGDDAMFVALEKLWAELWPERQLTAIGLPWEERRLGRFGLAGERYFEGALLGGGTLIGPFWGSQVQTLLNQNVPLWALGSGAGSCGFVQGPQLDLKEWGPRLRDFVRVGVRGPLSYAKLQEIGAPAKIIGDLALLLTKDAPALPSSRPRVGFNLALPQAHEVHSDEEGKLREIETALLQWVRDDWDIVPFAMNAVDIAPTQAALERVGLKMTVPLYQSADEFFRHIGPCAFVVAVRLHAAILASCVGVPTLMLGYRDKCLDFMASVGMENWHVDLLDFKRGDILEVANALSLEAPTLRQPLWEQARRWQETLHAFNADIVATAKSAAKAA